ncbi:MAG: sensor histidine kinase, partial [Acidimicrobiia bacterium]|nr:sensor histidine kinase [Acidimicrobiia bacterium]
QLAKMQTDPDKLGSMLDDLGTDVTETIEEMRELAHGIYPPLLRDAGLGDALKRAAERSSIPVIPDISLDRRFDPTIEAAVYFCCLEAMQNAAKHAGPTAEVVLSVSESDGILRFEVADDGAGFDATSVGGSHGFVNMADRLGAHDGTLGVESTPGAGTTIRGEVPVGQDAVGASDDAPQP